MKHQIALMAFSLAGAVFANTIYTPDKFQEAVKVSPNGFRLNKPEIPADTSKDYTALVKRSFDWALNHNVKKTGIKKINSPGAMYTALVLYDRTGDKKYLDNGLAIFNNILERFEKEKVGFGDFDGIPFVKSVLLLKKHKALTPEQEKRVHRIIEREMIAKPYTYFRYGNRELGKMGGQVMAAYQLYPDDPAFEPFRKNWTKWWDSHRSCGALDENSGNYSSLGLYQLLDILEATGRLEDLRTPAWQNQFAVYRDLVTPSGNMPEFGDDYFEHGGNFAWMRIFEFASKFYNDPSFAAAAKKLKNRHWRYFNYFRIPWHFNIYADLAYVDPDQRTAPQPLVTGINHRNDAVGATHPYFMILRPDLNPGSPMIAIDLYSKGDHAHMEKPASIIDYEADNVLLNHGFYRHLGRQTGTGGNGISVQQYGDRFPFFHWPEGKDLTVSIPAARFGFAEGKSGKRVFHFFYPDNTSRNDSTIRITNLRLEGPAGVKMIDQGPLVIPPKGRFKMKDYNVAFDEKEYSALRYEIRYLDGNPPKSAFRYRDDSLNNYNAWHGPSEYSMVLHSRLKDAKTDVKQGDSFGVLNFDEFGSFDSRYTRRIVLTKEGALIIREVFEPGKTLDNWTAGLTWQLYSLGTAGKNYFASKPDEAWSCDPADAKKYSRGILVVFDPASEDDIGIATEDWGRLKPGKYTVFAKFPVKAGQREARTMVVLPYRAGEKPDELAKQITFNTNDKSSKVKFRLDNTDFTVNIADSGDWNVTRNLAK